MASSLLLEEQTGIKRSLELRGNGLPHHWAAFPVEQRVVTKWNPGNGGEATQQVLGPREGSPEWEGEWNTTLLVSAPALYSERGGLQQKVARARTLVNLVEAIVRGGALVKLTWTEDDSGQLPIVRLGRPTKLEPAYRSNDDVRWRLTWEWKGRGPTAKRVANFKKDGQLSSTKKVQDELANVTAELSNQKIAQAFGSIPFSASNSTLGQLEAFVDGIKGFTKGFANQITLLGSRIKEIGDLAASVESLPADVAQQFADACANVKADCADFADAVSRRGPEAYAAFDQSASVKTLVAGSKSFGSAHQAAMQAAAAAVEAQRAVLLKSGQQPGSTGGAGKPSPQVLAIVVARAGDTFASIAKAKLGNGQLGPAVAKASGYPAFALGPTVGELVVVPEVAAAAQLMP